MGSCGASSRDVTPSLNDYAHMRQHTAGGLATTSWIEIVDGAEIPAAELDSPAVRALSELAFTIAAWDDDLFSYGKETWFARRETPSNCKLNLIDIVALERGYSVEAALVESVELVNG
ncbi:terpene synthase family protein [Kutzneria kofuensis]|uniref:terpene synthase family protein n=1 Tax=Kutzneria kofuensis TaxID=103725 RepID=UPI0031ED75FC